MSMYYVRQDGQTAYGPYDAQVVKTWIADGQLPPETECSTDGQAWSSAAEVYELGGARAAPPPPPPPVPQEGFPEISLLIRQGAGIQGPYRMSRIRSYVAQRRIQPYMLFSQDGIFWLGPEHVPGLIPPGYVPVAPPGRPSAVPSSVGSGAGPASVSPRLVARASEPSPSAGADIGSVTLTGYELDEADLIEPSPGARSSAVSSASSASTFPGAASTTLSYYVRQDRQNTRGPYAADVLREWIAQGQIGPSTEFSRDGRTWVLGASLPGFFAPSPSSRAAGPKSRYRS